MPIRGPGPWRIVRSNRAFAGDGRSQLDEYLDKLARMAPTEVVAFYLGLRPFIVSALTEAETHTDSVARWWPLICAALAIVVRIRGTHAAGTRWSGQAAPIVIAVIAFLLWVLAMGHDIAVISSLLPGDRRIPALAGAVFTFVVPYFYQGERPPAGRPAAAAPEAGTA